MDELDAEAVQEEAQQNAEMAERFTKEMEAKSKLEGIKALHEYELSIETCKKLSIDLEAAREELEIVVRDEARLHEEYKRCKAEFKEFPSSSRLKSAFKVAKKNHNDADEKLQSAQNIVNELNEKYIQAKKDKSTKLRLKKKYEEGGAGMEKDWRLRQSKYGLGLPNSPAEQLLNMLAKNKDELERQRHKDIFDKFHSHQLLLSGDRNRNRVIKSSIDLLQPLRNLLIIRRGEDTDNITKDPLKIPAWLFSLLPGGGKVIASKYRWDGSSFPNSISTPFRLGDQLIAKYDNIIEPLFGPQHIWTIAGVKKLLNNATDGGSSGIIAHGHRKSGKSYCLFHMGGHVQPVAPKQRPISAATVKRNKKKGKTSKMKKPIICKIPMIGDARSCRIHADVTDGLLPRCIDAIFDRNNGLDNIAPKSDYVFERKDVDKPPPEKYAAQFFFFVEISGIVVRDDLMIDLSKYKEGKQNVKLELRWNTGLKTYEPGPLTWTLCKTRHETRSVVRHLLMAHKEFSQNMRQQTNTRSRQGRSSSNTTSRDTATNNFGSLIITLKLVRPLDPHHPVSPDMTTARRIAFVELEGFDIGTKDVKHDANNPTIPLGIRSLENIIVQIKLRNKKIREKQKQNKKKKKEKKGGMSAVETDENEIHFNLSLLTKILQQYVGGGKILPLRPTQTILVSCVGPQNKYSAGSARTLMLSSEKLNQALHTLTKGFPEPVADGFDFAKSGDEEEDEDGNGTGNGTCNGDDDDDTIENGKGGSKNKGGIRRNKKTKPWKTGIPPVSERDGSAEAERQREQRRSEIVTRQFNTIQERRAFLGGKRTDQMKSIPQKSILIHQNRSNGKRILTQIEKNQQIIREKEERLIELEVMNTSKRLTSLSLIDSPHNHNNNIFPQLIKNNNNNNTVVLDRKLIQEEIDSLKQVQHEQHEQEQEEIRRRKSTMMDVEKEEGETPWPWKKLPRNSELYGNIDTKEYKEKIQLTSWLEDLAVAGGYGDKK